MQVRHRRIEREHGVEREPRRLARKRERLVAAQRDPIRVADRRDRRKPVERTAQHDHQQARIAAFGERNPRQMRPRKQRAGREQQLPSGWSMQVDGHGLSL